MIVDWIYNNPTWLWGTILVALFAAVSCVVLLAFIAIATWESFSKASDIVESESDFAGGIYLDTQGLPQAKGQPIRDAVAHYVGVVINDEWPIQRAGKTPYQGWKPLREINTAIATIQPQNLGEAVIEAELLKAWNELYQTRSSRLSAVQVHVPGVVWWIVFFGAAITTGYTYFFGYQNFGMHMAMTATLAATLALVVVLIVALDWPFRGEISVTPDPFVMTQQSWSQVSFDKK